MQLRKCCNHPFLLAGVEDEVKKEQPNANPVDFFVNASGKFVFLDKLLPFTKTKGRWSQGVNFQPVEDGARCHSRLPSTP